MNEKQQAQRVMNDRVWARIVLGRIKQTGIGRGSLKQWAVLKLLQWQPLAKRIRFAGKCHCGSTLMLTYQLADDHDRGENSETCGYYCPRCGFGNAGSRDKAVR